MREAGLAGEVMGALVTRGTTNTVTRERGNRGVPFVTKGHTQ